MAYTVPAAQNLGHQAYTVTGVIQLMAGNNPPASIAFPNLGNPPGNTQTVPVSHGVAIQTSPNAEVVRSAPLITCASVCYVNSQSTVGYVYHANAGHVPNADFNNAMLAIGAAGPPYNTVYIAYAHPGDSDQGYQATIGDLVNWGVPTNNIVEITNLFIHQFGMNNLLQIGY
ncbi:MAG: hypothetical protein MJA83_19060 [Gammaproteobacteria bacterium]|nr:hypothetical protein [Gammaproteobacteria bacterium]